MAAEITGPVPSSVSKAFALVAELSTAVGPQRLSELARCTGMTKPSAHRLLRALTAMGYARTLGSGQYAAGPALIGVSAATLGGLKERPLIHRTLAEVHGRTGMTASYAMRWAGSVVVIDNIEPDQAYRISPRLGIRTPLPDSAAGIAMLAAEGAADPAVDSAPVMALTPERSAAVVAARSHRYAVDTTQAGICAVAAAVCFGGAPAGALMVTGLSFGLNAESIEVIGPMLVEQADALAATVRATLPSVAELAEGIA